MNKSLKNILNFMKNKKRFKRRIVLLNFIGFLGKGEFNILSKHKDIKGSKYEQ